MKVTVFGPVVNLAARLESMTKFLNASIVSIPPPQRFFVRRMPPEYGPHPPRGHRAPLRIEVDAVEVSELMPPAAEF